MPSRKTTTVIVGALLLLGGGYLIYQRTPKKRKKKTSADEETLVPPKIPKPIDLEGSVSDPAVCTDLGPSYPGFEFDPTTKSCIPGPDTPTGIYIIDSCQDFIFHSQQGMGGEVPSAQTNDLEQMAESAANAFLAGEATADTIAMATQFFNKWWPDCQWPPAVDASDRIRNLFQFIAFQLGSMVIDKGGKAYNFDNSDALAEFLSSKFQEMGYPPINEEIIEELMGGGDTMPYRAHGLGLSADCKQLTVLDLTQWIAWSRNWLVARVKSYATSQELVQYLLGTAFIGSPCTIDINNLFVNGVSVASLVDEADAIAFASMRAGIPTVGSGDEASPVERASAKLLNTKPPKHEPPSFPYLGFAVYLEKLPEDDDWAWAAYENGEVDSEPTLSDTNASWQKAVADARLTIISVV